MDWTQCSGARDVEDSLDSVTWIDTTFQNNTMLSQQEGKEQELSINWVCRLVKDVEHPFTGIQNESQNLENGFPLMRKQMSLMTALKVDGILGGEEKELMEWMQWQ